MKKKIISLCLVVALALTAIGGATLAYFTDYGLKTNNFTIGNIDIVVNEKGYVWDNNGTDYTNGSYVAGPWDTENTESNSFTFDNLMPSYIVSKRPTVKNLTKNDAYVRVAVVINNLNQINQSIDNVYEAEYEKEGLKEDQIEAAVQAIYTNVFAGWGINHSHSSNEDGAYGPRMWMTQRKGYYGIDMAAKIYNADGETTYYLADVNNTFKSDDESNDPEKDGYLNDGEIGYYDQAVKGDERVYVFYFKLNGNTTSKELFGGLNIPADFNNDQMKMFSDLKIGIYADAIQTVGFKDYNGVPAWRQAFDTLQNEHPLGWWNTTTTPTT